MAAAGDDSWAEVARATRGALALLGRRIADRCLPGEPDHCGGSFAQHAMAHLAALKAVADHQLQHLGPEFIWRHGEIYWQERRELEERCGRHA